MHGFAVGNEAKIAGALYQQTFITCTPGLKASPKMWRTIYAPR